MTSPARVDVRVDAPPGLVPSPAAVDEACRRLGEEPGLAAVVLVDGSVVGHATLLSRVTKTSDEDHGAWVARLEKMLVAKGYLVDRGHRQSLARRPHGLRLLVRTARRLARLPAWGAVVEVRRIWRRWCFLRRLRWEARLAGTRVRLDIAEDLVVGTGVRVQIRPQGATVRIGPRCTISSGCILRLGGELVMERNVELRWDVALNVKGRLLLQARTVLGRGTMVHADAELVLEWGTTTAEYVTILDSHHEFDGSLVPVFDQAVVPAPVSIGAGTLIGAKATVLPGVRVGSRCIIGAHSVVTGDLPDGSVAVGVPARVLRQVGAPQS